MSGIFNVSKVYDPRINLTHGIIAGQNSVNLTIEEGSSSVQYFHENASSAANSSIQWTNLTWSPALGLGRFIYVSFPVRFTFTKSTAQASNLINPNTDAPRSHFMRCCTTTNVTFLNSTLTENPNQYLSALSWYNKKSFSTKTSFGFSHILDNDTTYNPANNNNVLSGYQNSGIYNSEGRGSYENILYTIVENTTTHAVVDVLYQEPLYISPFMLSGDEKFLPPIVGVQNFTINLSLNPLPQLLWSHSASSGITFANNEIQVEIGSLQNTYGSLPVLHYQLFEIPRSIVADPIHTSWITQYNSTKVVIQQFGALTTLDGEQQYTFNTFTPVSIPKSIYVFFNESDNNLSVQDPFTFGTIKTVNVTFGNGQNLLTSIVPLKGSDFNSDLFQIICQKNGLQMTASQFCNHVGSVLCINPVEDLNLSKWTSGELNLTNLQIQCTVKNNTGRDIINLIGTIVIIQEGGLIYNGNSGTSDLVVNIVNPSFINTANVKTDALYYYNKNDENYLGGLSLSELAGDIVKSTLKRIPYSDVVGKYVHKSIPYLQQALPYVEKFTASYDQGNGVIGGRICGDGSCGSCSGCMQEESGGRRIRKSSLRHRMLKNR